MWVQISLDTMNFSLFQQFVVYIILETSRLMVKEPLETTFVKLKIDHAYRLVFDTVSRYFFCLYFSKRKQHTIYTSLIDYFCHISHCLIYRAHLSMLLWQHTFILEGKELFCDFCREIYQYMFRNVAHENENHIQFWTRGNHNCILS